MKKKRRIDLKFITIFFSSILTLFTFLVLIVVLTTQIGRQIEEKQKENFNDKVNTIKNELSKNETGEVLEKYSRQGYSIVVFDQSNNVVYPKFSNKTNLLLNPEGLMSSFNYNKQRIVISYPMSINSRDATLAYFNILPVATLVLVLIIYLVLKIYLKIFKTEMSKIENLISDIRINNPYTNVNNTDYNIKVYEFNEIADQLKELHEQNQLKKQELNEEIAKVSKLQSNSVSLFNSITHEMKTPLMSSKLIIERFDQNTMTNKNIQLLEELTKELQFLENFTKEILFIAQRKNYSASSYQNSVTDALKKVEHNYSVLLKEKKIFLDIFVRENFVMNLDRLLIEKILSNLISNAIFYSEYASIIEITITSYSITIKNNIDSSEVIEKTSLFHKKTGLGIFLINMMLLESEYTYTTTNREDEYIVVISKYPNNPSNY